ncbi:alpha/beta fold hydrolase [Luteolibacter arcticus]|uniref:Alpha/beta fold hydrolase n=1 Tax=Luteolibacter arcticus TaxID=1581411 RepID=A0ABT3GNM4_9BACT|nr:alpha/beta fold hydrolase [Luteolibacter arcticus]MCW1925126.1 alpha/beta fold hydrolase [Luteolibacter arcticus]
MNRPGNTKRRRIKRRLAIAGVVLAVLGVVSCGFTTRLVSEAIVQPARKGVAAPLPEDLAARTFVLPDKVEMRVWEARPNELPKAAMLVLHGVSDSKASQVETLRYLARRGVFALAPDFRAHGDSGGKFATYGYLEKKDLTLLRKVVEKEFPGIPVGLWGTSYGGAVALQAMGADENFDFAIIESTFADLREIARDQVTMRTTLPVSGLGPYFVNEAGKLASFDPSEVAPERAIEKVRAPVLHLHGEADELIPISQGWRIASHAKGSNYRFVPISRGTHYHLRAGDPAKYKREVDAFLDRMVDGR